MLGAGGAARAISVECALDGAAKVNIANRGAERGTELAALINERTGADAEYLSWDTALKVPADTDILINATSVGLYPNVNDKPDVDYNTIKPEMTVSDVIFNDPHTLFLWEAERRGRRRSTDWACWSIRGA